jgi:hypothetical protein
MGPPEGPMMGPTMGPSPPPTVSVSSAATESTVDGGVVAVAGRPGALFVQSVGVPFPLLKKNKSLFSAAFSELLSRTTGVGEAISTL